MDTILSRTRYDIIRVTEAPKEMIESMHLHYVTNIEDGIALAKELLAKKVICILHLQLSLMVSLL